MARSSLTNIPGFSVKFYFQPIYIDYANLAYFDKKLKREYLGRIIDNADFFS